MNYYFIYKPKFPTKIIFSNWEKETRNREKKKKKQKKRELKGNLRKKWLTCGSESEAREEKEKQKRESWELEGNGWSSGWWALGSHCHRHRHCRSVFQWRCCLSLWDVRSDNNIGKEREKQVGRSESKSLWKCNYALINKIKMSGCDNHCF